MDPGTMLKLMGARKQFTRNHPKFTAFLNAVFSGGLEEGTVIEVTVQKPGQEELRTNLKVQQSDLELLQGLREMMNK